jgi:hypothetical protein
LTVDDGHGLSVLHDHAGCENDQDQGGHKANANPDPLELSLFSLMA